MTKLVLDTSVIINGQISKEIEAGSIKDLEIIIPVAVMDELQTQATQKRDQGFLGLNEIKKIQSLSPKFNLKVKFEGNRPTIDDIQLSDRGRIDSLIVEVAKRNEATLVTSDKIQALASEAEGISTEYKKPDTREEDLEFLRFFDSQTMSVHLKEGLRPMAKRGTPGSFTLMEIEKTPLDKDFLQKMSSQIFKVVKTTKMGNIEISKPGAVVIQLQDYRIAITQPPFSERYEITIVHPIARLTLDEYGLSDKLKTRFTKQAEGILISGPPGSGKSTLASSLADFYNQSGKIVKTFESPRDLQVDPSITQYTRLDGSFANSADILLLVRPDYTIFDEVRRHEDFGIFSDLRLSGVGMVGVIHANSPIDAIQRFIGKIELGIIPSVIDTVIFVSAGKISKIYELELKVKVPSGMIEQDLARPVIEIRDFEDGTLEYEIYTFGEENVIVPVSKKEKKFGIERLAEERLQETFRRFDPHAKVEILSGNNIKVKVDKKSIPSLIGRGGSTINELEKQLQVHIDVVEKEESEPSDSQLDFDFSESKNALLFNVGKKYSGEHADLFINDDYITSSRIGRKGLIKIPKRSNAAKRLMTMASSKNAIGIFIKH